MRPYGKVNLIGLVIVFAVVYGIWWGAMYGPAYLDNIDVKAGVTASLAVAKQDNDEAVKNTILLATNGKALGWHHETAEDGTVIKKPGLGIAREQVFVERNDATQMITVRLEYDREIELNPFDKIDWKHFVVEMSGSTKP